MSEHILWETIEEQNEKIAVLENQNCLLGERCNQLLKDKGDLTDEVKSLEEELADYKFNYPTIKELSKENADLKKQIEKMKCCALCNNYNMNYLPYWCRTNCVPMQPYEKCKCWEIKENE